MNREKDIIEGKTPEQRLFNLDAKQKDVLRALKDLQNEHGFHFSLDSMIYVDDSDWIDDVQELLDVMPS